MLIDLYENVLLLNTTLCFVLCWFKFQFVEETYTAGS